MAVGTRVLRVELRSEQVPDMGALRICSCIGYGGRRKGKNQGQFLFFFWFENWVVPFTKTGNSRGK